jgi:general secretion pathway protein G
MKTQRGFSLLELIIVISIVAVLAGMFLNKVPLNQELAEKAAMEQMAGAFQTALVMRYGSMLANGAATEKELGKLAAENPMGWLQQKPENYAGEFFDPAVTTVPPGQWMFDLKSRDLIFVLNRSEYFTPGKDGQKWIRFHVKFEYETGVAGGKSLVSTLFVPTSPYRWMN